MRKKFMIYCSYSLVPYITAGKSYEAEWDGEEGGLFRFICDDGDCAWDSLKNRKLGYWSVVGEKEEPFIIVPADTSVSWEISKAEQEKAVLLRVAEHATEQWREAQRNYDISRKHSRVLEDRIELLALSLRSLILAVESGLKNPDGFPISDVEHEVYLARGAYYHVKQESVEGEK